MKLTPGSKNKKAFEKKIKRHLRIRLLTGSGCSGEGRLTLTHNYKLTEVFILLQKSVLTS